MNRFFTLLLLLVSFCDVAYSQDFIVLTTGDTLYGDLKPIDVDYYNGIILETESGTSEFTPNETDLFGIRSFMKDGRIYEAGISKNKFAEKFVEGTVQFYQDDKDFFLLKDERIFLLPFGNKQVHDQDGVIKEVQVDAWKTILKNLLADCSGQQYRRIDKLQFPSREFLVALGLEYNTCQGQELVQLKEKEKVNRMSFSGGYGAGLLILGEELVNDPYPYDSPFDNSAFFDLGFKYGMKVTLFKHPAFVDVGFEYRKSTYESNRTSTSGFNEITDQFKITRNSLVLPVGLTVPLQSLEKGFNLFAHGLGEIRLSEMGLITRTARNTDSGT
ncbi:MAG: hypothetical protein RIF46_00800, partial [Cyclobacteriaceae bacterium]